MSKNLSRRERLAARQFSSRGQGKFKILSLPENIPAMILEPEETTVLDFVLFPVNKNHPNYSLIKKDAEEYGEDRLVDWKFEYAVHKRMNGLPEVICRQFTYGQPCPVCEAKKTRMDEEDLEWDDKKLESYAYSKRVAYLVSEIDAEGNGSEYKVLDYPYTWLHKGLEEKGKAENILFLDESENGHSVAITPVEHEFDGNTMAGKCMIKFRPRTVGFSEEDLDAAVNIVDFFNIQTYDEIFEILHGVSDDEKDTKDEVATESSNPPGRRTVSKENDFEEETTAEQPSTSRRSSRRTVTAENVETPKSSRRRKSVSNDFDEENIAF